MSDLISRQAALDTIEWTWAGKAAFDALKALPSVDAVEIVRCRDCEHYFTSDMERAKNHGAECTMMNRRTMPEDYCSYGQKM